LLVDVSTNGKDSVSRFEWSPNGKYILISWAASGGKWGIGRIDVAAKTATEFVPHGNPGMVFDARYSPAGHSVVFSRESGGLSTGDLRIADSEGQNERSLNTGVTGAHATDWSADGRIYFYSSDEPASNEIYSILADGTDLQRLTDNDFADQYPDSWAPRIRESRLAIQSDRDGDNDIYEIDLYGSVIRQLTDSPGEDGSPAYSPDGTRIAFYSDRNGSDREIFVMNHDLTGLVQLTFNDVDDVMPTWCGNDLIAYLSDFNNVHIMNADGSNSHLLISGQAPSCTSDGTALLVNQSGDIVKVDPMNGTKEFLKRGGAAVWSPDETQIAFDDGTNLFVMDVASKEVIQITNDPATDANPQWAPGPAIVFTSHRPGNSEAYIINSDGSDLRNITMNSARDGQAALWVPSAR
jgi:Tol biopolymer transport system component